MRPGSSTTARAGNGGAAERSPGEVDGSTGRAGRGSSCACTESLTRRGTGKLQGTASWGQAPAMGAGRGQAFGQGETENAELSAGRGDQHAGELDGGRHGAQAAGHAANREQVRQPWELER